MNRFVLLMSLVCSVAQAGLVAVPAALPSTLVRAPEHDSAAIESHRLGGNFAYGVVTAEAFAKITPKLDTITHPVAETTVVHEPAPIATVQPAPIQRTVFSPQPVFRDEAILAQQPIVGPVATTTTLHQPVFKTATLVQHQPLAFGPAYAPAYPAGYAAGYAPWL